MGLKSKDLLGIRELSVEEIRLVLDTAASMKEIASRDIKKVPALRGKTVINLFYEPSTRTRTSFEIAGKWLSADVINISTSASSVVKGESLKDTGLTLQAMHPDVVVIRHAVPGAPHLLARWLKASIINAGDGAHEHPTQALLDLFTIRERRPTLDGLRVAIVGDILHSRVARSNIFAMQKMGMHIVHFGAMMIINLCYGLITPPVGTSLFVGLRISGLSMNKIIRPLLPLLAIEIVILVAVTYWPPLSMWLPRMFGFVM